MSYLLNPNDLPQGYGLSEFDANGIYCDADVTTTNEQQNLNWPQQIVVLFYSLRRQRRYSCTVLQNKALTMYNLMMPWYYSNAGFRLVNQWRRVVLGTA